MALYTTMNQNSNKTSTQFYPYLWKLYHIYDSTLYTLFNMNDIHQIHFIEQLNRSSSTESIILTSKYLRTNSLHIQRSILNNSNVSTDIDEDDHIRHYSTKTPYRNPSHEYRLSSTPIGYKPVCVQLLARHGSRTLTCHDYDLQTLRIWHLAKQKNMLTPLGEQLKEDIERFMDANNSLGRGELTELGKTEHIGIGERLYSRFQSLFTSSNTIHVMTSGKKRAMDSAEHFLSGLTKSQSNLQISSQNPNKNLLYFHKICSRYMDFKKNDLHIRTKLNTIKNSEQTKIFAQQVLQRIYQNEFVNLLINGKYENALSNENIDSFNETKKTNEINVVLWLYNMFSIAPALNESHSIKILAKYFNQEESKWFAYINDAQEFYIKGPSIEGRTVTYDMAKPLLIDFFSSIDTCIEHPNKIIAGHLRFAHAETIIPFTSLLQIPGLSDQAVDRNDIYTYENNHWRGAQVSSMAANLQWEIYQHEDDPHQILVRMLYNEREVRFKNDCQSITPNSYFYDLNELKRSYGNSLLSSVSEKN